MLITKRKHEEAIKAKDLQIEGLNTRLSAQSNKIAALEARLAPFDRARGAGGRFVKAAPQYDEVRAQFESECG